MGSSIRCKAQILWTKHRQLLTINIMDIEQTTVALSKVCALVAAMIPLSLQAQERVVESEDCKVRIITTSNLQIADSTNFRKGGLVGGLLSGMYQKQDPLRALDIATSEVGPEGQQRLIAENEAFFPSRFASYEKMYEAGFQRPLAAFQEAKRTGRLSSSDAPCVFEFSVVAVTYVRTSLSREIGYLFMFREFGPEQKAKAVVTYADMVSVKAFPPKSEADVPAAKTELSAAFIKTLKGFFEKVGKQR